MAINVMVSFSGVNEDGKIANGLHTFVLETEAELNEWIAKAPAQQRNIDNGPPIRVEMERRKF